MSALDDILNGDILERIMERIEYSNGCLVWTGNVNSAGYGTMKVNKRNYTVHRLSYIIHHGTIPPSDLDVMHLCDNKRCVNPEHIRLGSRSDNIQDFISKGGEYGRRGELNHFHKISNEQFVEIKMRLNNGEQKTKVAKDYGIRRQSIDGRLRREAA